MSKVRYYHFEDNGRLEETIRALKDGTRMNLWRVELAVTSLCSLACKYCRVVKVPDQLTLEIIQRLIGEAKELGTQHFHIIGGEPTIRKDLPEIIEATSRHGITTSLVTRGVSKNTTSRDYVQSIVANGLGSLTVSLDTPDARKNDETVGVQGAWQRTVDFLVYANDARQSSQHSMPIYINTVADRETIFELPERLEFYGRFGFIDDVKLLLVKGNRRRSIDRETYQRFKDEKLEQVIELSRKCGFVMFENDVRILLGSDDPTMQERVAQGRYYLPPIAPCYLSLSELFIASNGDVYNCAYHFWHASPNIRGNVVEQDLRNIWGSYNPLQHDMKDICDGLCTRRVIDFNNLADARLRS